MNTTKKEYQPKTGAKCTCKKGIERDNCATCEGTGFVIDFKKIRQTIVEKRIQNLNNLQRMRGFKVETMQATDTKPNRIKVTDLRFSKSVVLNYGAKHNSLTDLLNEFFTDNEIKLCAQSWAENSDSIHLYGLYFTENFTSQIK